MIEFNLTKTQEKKFALMQRMNFERLSLDPSFALGVIEFPESSILLQKISDIANSKNNSEVQGRERLFEYVLNFSINQDEAYFLILPGLLPQNGFTYTKYPAIKVDAKKIHPLLNLVRGKIAEPDYFSLVSEKLEHGIVLDVYAGNPELHGTDKEILQIATW